MALQTGQIINNRYRIVKLLGQGGFGAVYRAWDLNMECPRALKENLDTSPEAKKQFKLEAQILGQLTHQNLPKVIDHFIIPGQGQYLVMEFVDGEDLREKLSNHKGPLPHNLVIPWIEQICDALSYLHTQNPPIVHRDIKPANIKITPQGVAVLVDFGIAKVFDPHLKTTLGAQAVTPGYSPLEQYGHGTTDARSDVYALGALIYVLITGIELPESTERAISDTVVPIEQVNPQVSPPVAAAIQSAINIDASRRLQSASEFKKALKASPTILITKTIDNKNIRQRINFRWLLAGSGLIILAIVAILMVISGGREPPPTPKATFLSEIIITTAVGFDQNTTGLDLINDATQETTLGVQNQLLTSTSTPTQIPTEIPSPTLTFAPSETPSQTPNPLANPEDFVQEYYAAIVRREYEYTFSLLSNRFKASDHDTNQDGVYEIDPYVDWWEKMVNIEILEIEIQQQSSSQALVYFLGRFYFKDGRVIDDQIYIHLISDGYGSWLIDDEGG